MSDEPPIWLVIGGAFAIAIALIAGFLWLMTLADRDSCHSRAEAMKFESSWSQANGCMIVVDGRMIPFSAYRVTKVVPEETRK